MSEQQVVMNRQGLIVWLSDAKQARQLERFGLLHYVSRKQSYAVLYVNQDRVDEVVRQLHKVQGVKRVESSYRHEVWETYTHSGIPMITANPVTVKAEEKTDSIEEPANEIKERNQ